MYRVSQKGPFYPLSVKVSKFTKKEKPFRDDVKKKRVKNGTLAQKVGRYQNKFPI